MDLDEKGHFKTIAVAPVGQREDWQKRQKRESSDSAPDPAYCLGRTEIMLSCYRRDETHNPEVYSSAVSAVLADGYSREIVNYVTDPRTGLPSRNKFLPSVAEVREACDERAGHIDRTKRYETLKPVPPREIPIVPGQVTYGEFLEHCEATGANPSPIGAFEPGGYLGAA